MRPIGETSMARVEKRRGDTASRGERAEVLKDLAVLGGVFVAYLLVRVAWAPVKGFARDHLTDLLAGVALPSLMALVLLGWAPWRYWTRSIKGKTATVLGAAIVWEGLVPLFSERSTADPLDVLCYVAGAMLQHGVSALPGPSSQEA